MHSCFKVFVITLVLSTGMMAESAFAAEVYFISPTNGEQACGELNVRFGLRGMGVTAAGYDVPNTGHHHLLIDVEELPDLGLPLPKSDQVRHFGGGQTEAVIQLSPGSHTLQLVLGNHLHIPHQPPVLSEKINIEICAD